MLNVAATKPRDRGGDRAAKASAPHTAAKSAGAAPVTREPRGSAGSGSVTLLPTPPSHPPWQRETRVDPEDSGEFHILDRVADPRSFAEIQRAYTELGRLINALPIRRRD